jgi:hypothetical protein
MGAPRILSLHMTRYAANGHGPMCVRAEWRRGVCFDKLGRAIVLNPLTDDGIARS